MPESLIGDTNSECTQDVLACCHINRKAPGVSPSRGPAPQFHRCVAAAKMSACPLQDRCHQAASTTTSMVFKPHAMTNGWSNKTTHTGIPQNDILRSPLAFVLPCRQMAGKGSRGCDYDPDRDRISAKLPTWKSPEKVWLNNCSRYRWPLLVPATTKEPLWPRSETCIPPMK